ncbi:hypothetical protein RBB78_20055 [Tunturiibacter empetritectus]
MKGTGNITQKIAWTTLWFGLAMGMAGCRHKPQARAAAASDGSGSA